MSPTHTDAETSETKLQKQIKTLFKISTYMDGKSKIINRTFIYEKNKKRIKVKNCRDKSFKRPRINFLNRNCQTV